MAFGYRNTLKGYKAALNKGADRVRALGLDTTDAYFLFLMSQYDADGSLKDVADGVGTGTIYGATEKSEKRTYFLKQNGKNEVIGKGQYLDGVDDYIQAMPSGYNPTSEGTNEVLVVMHTLPSDIGVHRTLFDKRRYENIHTIVRYIDDAIHTNWHTSASYNDLNGNTPLQVSKLYHIVSTFKSGDASRIYINGVLDAELSVAVADLVYYDDPVYLGKSVEWPEISYPHATYYLASFYHRAFSSNEVAERYKILKDLMEV